MSAPSDSYGRQPDHPDYGSTGMRAPTQPSWIDRVRQADADAEEAWKTITTYGVKNGGQIAMSFALTAIAAELRAQRISRRSGAGQ